MVRFGGKNDDSQASGFLSFFVNKNLLNAGYSSPA